MGSKRCVTAIALFSALLMACTTWIVGIHHHDPATSHSCAVCTSAHAPATVSFGATAVSVPRPVVLGVIDPHTAIPAGIAPGIAPGRAPPIS